MMTWLQSLPVPLQTTVLLLGSNVFMTFAWYGLIKDLEHKAWWLAALISWGIALFEYLLQVPANRIGATQMNVGQLKVMQEVISLSVGRTLPRGGCVFHVQKLTAHVTSLHWLIFWASSIWCSK